MTTGNFATGLHDRDDAAQLLEEELREGAYQRPFAGPLREALNDLFDWLSERAFSIGGLEIPFGPLLVLAVVVAAVVVTILLVRPRLQRASAPEAAVEIDPQVSAEQLRSRAAAHAAAGDFDSAAQDAFRAMVRSAEQAGALPAQQGRTATEIAAVLSGIFAGQATQLRAAAEMFNRSAYGAAQLAQTDYHSVHQLDQQLHLTEAGAPR